ncbi:accessory Sec system protein Asp3 [Enterococcus sp. LJL98]
MRNYFFIKWGNGYRDSFNYGTEITIQENGDVHYQSPLMPSGKTIKVWKSITQFHVDREPPMLPLLIQSKKYHIRVEVEGLKDRAIQLRLDFFDAEQELIGEEYFLNLEGTFVFPEDAVSYTVQLINKNVQSFTFKYIYLLEDRSYEEEEPIESLLPADSLAEGASPANEESSNLDVEDTGITREAPTSESLENLCLVDEQKEEASTVDEIPGSLSSTAEAFEATDSLVDEIPESLSSAAEAFEVTDSLTELPESLSSMTISEELGFLVGEIPDSISTTLDSEKFEKGTSE